MQILSPPPKVRSIFFTVDLGDIVPIWITSFSFVHYANKTLIKHDLVFFHLMEHQLARGPHVELRAALT